jgi:hypothetical protein
MATKKPQQQIPLDFSYAVPNKEGDPCVEFPGEAPLTDSNEPSEKPLHITSGEEAKTTISDLKVFGDADTFQLICKASSASQGWMKSTKAMQIDGVGCVVQVTTQHGDEIAEALTFVPGVRIEAIMHKDEVIGRKIVKIKTS